MLVYALYENEYMIQLFVSRELAETRLKRMIKNPWCQYAIIAKCIAGI